MNRAHTTSPRTTAASRAPADSVDSGSIAPELHRLSDGRVAKVARVGPVLARRNAPRRRLLPVTFTDALSRRDQVLVIVLSGCWLGTVLVFWSWWLEPAHLAGAFGLAANSAVLAYVTAFPAFFIAGANRLRRVNPDLTIPRTRVAFVVTHAPAEPWPVARRTLTAMLAQDYPYAYDVWICPERPTREITAWCRRHGVRISTRDGEPGYQRDSWPRRARCKEGNLAYFYDRVGYRDYDVVAQLDCDHTPAPGYLAEMVRPFADPAIGYVAAPSVCDANAAASWPARGRLYKYKEATFHGAFQLGHSAGLAPLCIGSHYAVRTAALAQIGGIGPDLAEDFSTTFLLSAAGWHGAFAIDAEAHGEGPGTFAAMAAQEFQWSRSLGTLLLRLVRPNLGRLSWTLRLRFLYALSYYFLLVATTLAGLVLAPVAAVAGLQWINVNYLAFLAYWWVIAGFLIAIMLLLRRRGLLRPRRAPVLSWESWLYSLARWPFVAFGLGAALIGLARPRPVSFKVTPKGGSADGRPRKLPARLTLPFAVISVTCAAAAIAGELLGGSPGYIFLSALGSLTYAVVALAVPVRHALEARQGQASPGTSRLGVLLSTARVPFSLSVFSLAAAVTAVASYPAFVARALGA